MKYSGLIYFGMVLYVFFANVYLAHAQVTIEEKIYLEPESTSHSRDSIEIEQFDLPLSNSWYEYYQHFFFPKEPGELNISLARGFSQIREIDSTATLYVNVQNGNKFRDTTLAVQPILGEPISGPRIQANPTTWYFYGADPFVFSNSLTNRTYCINALVRLGHEAEYDSENKRYIYTGSVTDENFSDRSHLLAAAYDWGKSRNFDDGRYYSVDRGYFKIDLEPFRFPIAYVDSATIEFMLWSRDPYRVNPDGFNILLSEVSEPWNQQTIAWENQPAAGNNTITLPNPEIKSHNYAYDYHTLDLTPTVIQWLEDPESNYGFSLALEDETSSSHVQSHKYVSLRTTGPWEPIIDIYFSNPDYSPEAISLNAGFVEPGDTVLISYNNGTDRITNAYSNRIKTRTVGGKSYRGRVQEFQDRQRRDDRPIGIGNRPEQLFIFTYVKKADKEELLLGETRYYAAIEDPENPTGIQINRVNTDPSGQPVMPPGMVEGAFEDEPVEILSGGKSGVYWERKWAHINADGSISGGDLPSGMIRLVGRYWEEDNDYRVKLNAFSGSRSGELEVEVVKPGRLGTEETIAFDVFNHEFSIDSLCITVGGKYGIPPQIIKAQMTRESQPWFTPSYRYEPFWDMHLQNHPREDVKARYYRENDPFIISVDPPNMGGHEEIFTDHINVTPSQYHAQPMYIADVLGESINQLVVINTLQIVGGHNQATLLEERLINIKDYIESNPILSQDLTNRQIAILARDSVEVELRTKNHTTRDRYLQIAQTRISASYGILQMMYTTAVDRIFKIIDSPPRPIGSPFVDRRDLNSPPELLNQHEYMMPRYADFLLQSLWDELGLEVSVQNMGENWKNDFQATWMNALWRYNPYSDNYGPDVYQRSLHYLPMK